MFPVGGMVAALVTLIAGLVVTESPVSTARSLASRPFYCSSSCSFSDPRGDAAAKVDIESGHLTNGVTGFAISFKVRSLPKAATVFISTGVSGYGIGYKVDHTLRGNQVVATVTARDRQAPGQTPAVKSQRRVCHGAHVRWHRNTDRVVLMLPYACSGSSPIDGTIIDGIRLQAGKSSDVAGGLV